MTIDSYQFELLNRLGGILPIDEGICKGFYICPAGKLSCGVGHNIEARPVTKRLLYRWLKHGMSQVDVDTLLVKDMLSTKASVENRYDSTDWYADMSTTRKLGWLNMAYQMGVPRQSKFENSIGLMSQGIFGDELYKELINSEWYREDTPERADRVASMIAYGVIPSYYDYTKPALIEPTLVK